MARRIKGAQHFKDVPAYQKVQYYFFDYPLSEVSLNDLCSLLAISKTTANRAVKALVRENFLNRAVIGKLWRISCNQKQAYNITRKIPYHLGLIYESDIIKAIYELIPNAKSIILFGSYRKGDDTDRSDIDIAVEILDDDDYKMIELGKVEKLGFRGHVSVSLHVFARNKINLNLFANIANGIVLDGFLEVRP